MGRKNRARQKFFMSVEELRACDDSYLSQMVTALGFCIFLSLIFIVWGIWGGGVSLLLTSFGKSANGTVVDIEAYKSEDGDVIKTAIIQFKSADKKEVRLSCPLGSLKKGDKVEVFHFERFPRFCPRINRPDELWYLYITMFVLGAISSLPTVWQLRKVLIAYSINS